MLIKINRFDKNKSVYECDRCKKVCKQNEKISIGIDLFCTGWKKKWDLCTHCYKSLCRGIQKGVNHNGGNS